MTLESKVNSTRTRGEDHGKSLEIMTEGLLIIVD